MSLFSSPEPKVHVSVPDCMLSLNLSAYLSVQHLSVNFLTFLTFSQEPLDQTRYNASL